MKPVILYRRGMDPDADQVETEAAEKHFPVAYYRTAINHDELVIGRMSVLPFYKELQVDVANMGGKLINSYKQHRFIADMKEWVPVLGDMTPRLYERLQDLPEKGPFVLKGETNSRKHQWATHMFAKTKRDATEVALRLMDDGLLKDQTIYARDYVPLVRLATGFNALPIAEEYRFFVAYGEVVCGAFYWASHTDDLEGVIPSADCVPKEFLAEAIRRIGDNANFYAIDIARKADGGWTVIEINDGQMSGLACNDPETFYKNLAAILNGTKE